MNHNKNIELIIEALNIENGSISSSTALDSIDEWDSMGKISLIAMLNKKFNILLDIPQIAELKTVQDILDKMK